MVGQGQGPTEENLGGYKAQIAESLPDKDALSQERFITSDSDAEGE